MGQHCSHLFESYAYAAKHSSHQSEFLIAYCINHVSTPKGLVTAQIDSSESLSLNESLAVYESFFLGITAS